METRRISWLSNWKLLFTCLLLTCVLLIIELKNSNFNQQTDHDFDVSFGLIRNACLSGKGLFYDERKVGISKNRLQYNTLSEAINIARIVQKYYNIVLVSAINDAYLPFAYSWLCNTADMDIHKSVLIITFDTTTRDTILSNWGKINVIALDIGDVPVGDQEYSHSGYVRIMIRRTQILYSLLQTGINLFLFEFDFVWFSNPLPNFNGIQEMDMLVNPVSTTKETVSAGGLILIYATERSKFLWKKLTEMMISLGERLKNIEDHIHVSGYENDQVYFSKLVTERYGDIKIGKLPLDRYADGAWYDLNDVDRRKTKPIMISNNFIKGKIIDEIPGNKYIQTSRHKKMSTLKLPLSVVFAIRKDKCQLV